MIIHLPSLQSQHPHCRANPQRFRPLLAMLLLGAVSLYRQVMTFGIGEMAYPVVHFTKRAGLRGQFG